MYVEWSKKDVSLKNWYENVNKLSSLSASGNFQFDEDHDYKDVVVQYFCGDFNDNTLYVWNLLLCEWLKSQQCEKTMK